MSKARHWDFGTVARGGKADGWSFIQDGVAYRRQRNPVPQSIQDLDYMTGPQLTRLMKLCTTPRSIFPARPLGYTQVCDKLYLMARLRLHHREGWEEHFDALYATLPPYAQFRNFWNVRAAVIPGKKFRKRGPKVSLDTLRKRE